MLVVGGGEVAYRKVQGILQNGAQIVVVSPTLSTSMQTLWRTETIQWVQRKFRETDVEGAFLIFAATNNSAVNEKIAASCSAEQLINICDNPNKSSFHVPAVHQHSYLTVAVSTNGISPLLAKKIRDEIAAQYDDYLEDYFEFLLVVRQQITQGPYSQVEKRAYLNEVLDARYKQSVEARNEFKARLSLHTSTMEEVLIVDNQYNIN